MVDFQDSPDGPVVKNPRFNAGDPGSIPGQGTKIPHATGQLSPRATTTEPVHYNWRARVPQTTEPTCSGAHVPQLERSLCAATKSPRAAMKDPACCNEDPTTKTQHSQKKKKVDFLILIPQGGHALFVPVELHLAQFPVHRSQSLHRY